jgi:hypothetical protein
MAITNSERLNNFSLVHPEFGVCRFQAKERAVLRHGWK